MNILVINSGSSSIKYKFYSIACEEVISKGSVNNIGEKAGSIENHRQGLEVILGKIKGVDAIGHRVVHGAEEFRAPVVIDDRVIRKIRSLCALAPLHNPANLEGIIACKHLLGSIRQVAVFDTSFYHSLPENAFIYGLPYKLYQKYKIRKYGFHGTSHEYVAYEAAKRLNKGIGKLNLITCHLGNGCSMTAIKKGRAIDTSMGFTPLEGLIMGTRCGDIDPALVTYIMQKTNVSLKGVEDILNKESGLKGISGVSNDMQKLREAAKKGNKRARLALEIFIYRARKYIGSYLGVLGRADAVVFTGGIGEHQPWITGAICRGLFDNLRSKPEIMVIPTDEELMIARQAYNLLRKR